MKSLLFSIIMMACQYHLYSTNDLSSLLESIDRSKKILDFSKSCFSFINEKNEHYEALNIIKKDIELMKYLNELPKEKKDIYYTKLKQLQLNKQIQTFLFYSVYFLSAALLTTNIYLSFKKYKCCSGQILK